MIQLKPHAHTGTRFQDGRYTRYGATIDVAADLGEYVETTFATEDDVVVSFCLLPAEARALASALWHFSCEID